MVDFDDIWSRIQKHAGEPFATKTGLPFTYQIVNSAVVTDRTEYPLSKSSFEKAAQIKNLQSPGQINSLVRGPAYVYAILTDARIKQDERNGSNMIYIGIDVGGMSIKAGVVDTEGNILFKHSCPTGVERGYGAVIRDIAELGISAVEKSGHSMDEVKAIGIGIPGIMDQRTGIVPFCTNLHWTDVPIIEEMKKYTDVPVFVDNDATVAGLAESVKGISAGCKDSVFVTLGTGVGGGVVMNGKVFSGAHGVATEIGHMVTVDGGELCTCGKRGCWERYASATALIREGRKLCAEKPNCALMQAVEGDISAITAKHVVDLAKEGDEDCTDLFNNYIHHLVVGLSNLINLYDPEVIVLGGGVSHSGEFLLSAVRAQLPKLVFFKNMPYARVELAQLTNDAGIIGAAMLGR